METRELLKRDFGIDLPIEGGCGNSMENAVIICKTPDYVPIEYAIVRCLCIGRGVEWKVIGQMLMRMNDRSYDVLRIETKEYTETEVITQIERYYFDITANI